MSMEQWWNDTDRGKLKYWEKNIIQLGSEWSSILILLASCQQTCMTYTIAVCTVKNS